MARRINPAAGPTETAEHKDEASTTGGSPGVPPEAFAPTQAQAVRVAAPDPEELAKLPAPKLYRVANGGRVNYAGVPTILRPGKVVSDATHDLGLLRRQGIQLEEFDHTK